MEYVLLRKCSAYEKLMDNIIFNDKRLMDFSLLLEYDKDTTFAISILYIVGNYPEIV